MAHRFGAEALLAAMLAAASSAGCHGCHENKPYTPYHLGDAPAASGEVEAGAPVVSDVDGGFSVVQAAAPKGDGKTWTLGATQVKAPAGRAFGLGLEVDADGDGKPDLLAWARAPDGLRGEIVFASGASPGDVRTVAALPGELAPAGCTAKVTLAAFGPHAAAFDFHPSCPPVSRDRATRWFAVVRWPMPGDRRPPSPELGLELKLGALPEGESLEPTVESIDKDSDGRRDVVVTLTMTGAPKPLPAGTAAAKLAFYDRPAGLSRDPAEPEAALKAALAALSTDARRPKGAAKVAAGSGALRRLASALCEEGNKAIVTTSAGPVRCGDVKIESDTALAELEAAVNLGEPVAAAAALARVDALGPSGPRKKDVDRLLTKPLPSIKPSDAKTLATAPVNAVIVGYGPLAFLANGDLLVHTNDGVTRADAAALAEAPAEPRPWASALAEPPATPAWTLSRVDQRCDAPTPVAHFEVKTASGVSDFEVPLPIPTSPRCKAGALPAISLGQNGLGALLAVGADVVQVPLGAPPSARAPDALLAEPLTEEQLGAARSPDGLTLAIPTPRGVLVATVDGSSRRAKASFWTGSDLEKATFCVPANGAKRVACVIAGKAVVATK